MHFPKSKSEPNLTSHGTTAVESNMLSNCKSNNREESFHSTKRISIHFSNCWRRLRQLIGCKKGLGVSACSNGVSNFSTDDNSRHTSELHKDRDVETKYEMIVHRNKFYDLLQSEKRHQDKSKDDCVTVICEPRLLRHASSQSIKSCIKSQPEVSSCCKKLKRSESDNDEMFNKIAHVIHWYKSRSVPDLSSYRIAAGMEASRNTREKGALFKTRNGLMQKNVYDNNISPLMKKTLKKKSYSVNEIGPAREEFCGCDTCRKKRFQNPYATTYKIEDVSSRSLGGCAKCKMPPSHNCQDQNCSCKKVEHNPCCGSSLRYERTPGCCEEKIKKSRPCCRPEPKICCHTPLKQKRCCEPEKTTSCRKPSPNPCGNPKTPPNPCCRSKIPQEPCCSSKTPPEPSCSPKTPPKPFCRPKTMPTPCSRPKTLPNPTSVNPCCKCEIEQNPRCSRKTLPNPSCRPKTPLNHCYKYESPERPYCRGEITPKPDECYEPKKVQNCDRCERVPSSDDCQCKKCVNKKKKKKKKDSLYNPCSRTERIEPIMFCERRPKDEPRGFSILRRARIRFANCCDCSKGVREMIVYRNLEYCLVSPKVSSNNTSCYKGGNEMIVYKNHDEDLVRQINLTRTCKPCRNVQREMIVYKNLCYDLILAENRCYDSDDDKVDDDEYVTVICRPRLKKHRSNQSILCENKLRCLSGQSIDESKCCKKIKKPYCETRYGVKYYEQEYKNPKCEQARFQQRVKNSPSSTKCCRNQARITDKKSEEVVLKKNCTKVVPKKNCTKVVQKNICANEKSESSSSSTSSLTLTNSFINKSKNQQSRKNAACGCEYEKEYKNPKCEQPRLQQPVNNSPMPTKHCRNQAPITDNKSEEVVPENRCANEKSESSSSSSSSSNSHTDKSRNQQSRKNTACGCEYENENKNPKCEQPRLQQRVNNSPSPTKCCGNQAPITDEKSEEMVPENICANENSESSSSSSSSSNSSIDKTKNQQFRKNTGWGCQCRNCSAKDRPTVTEGLADCLSKLTEGKSPRKFSLVVMVYQEGLYHISILNLSSGKTIACVYASVCAVKEANQDGVFEKFLTFFVLDDNANDTQRNEMLKVPFK